MTEVERPAFTTKSALNLSLFLALVLRVIWILFVDVAPVSDSAVYDQFARSIVEGNGYAFNDGSKTAFWPVGTSAFYAGVYYFFGYNYLIIELLNLFLGLLIVWLGWLVCRNYFDTQTANITAYLLALWPLLITFSTVLSSELIFIALLLLVLKVVSMNQRYTIRKAVIFGMLVGLGCYVKPIMLPLIVIIPFLRVFRGGEVGESIRFFIVSTIVLMIIIAPWSYRNTLVFGEFTTLTTNFGPNLWMGNNPKSDGSYMPLPDRTFINEKDRENQLKTEAIDFIKDNPSEFLSLAVKRLIITFSRETIGVLWNQKSLKETTSKLVIDSLKVVSSLYWLALLSLAIVGVFLTIFSMGWSSIVFPPMVVGGFLFSIPLIIVGQDRYHMPMIPIVAFFAASTIAKFIKRRQAR